MTYFPEWFSVNIQAGKHVLHILQDEELQEGAPIELVPIDVGDTVAALLSHNAVEEDVLGDAQVGAVGEELVPGLTNDAIVQLLKFHLWKIFPQESRDKDVIQPCRLHQGRIVLDRDLGQSQTHLGGGDVEPAGTEVRKHPPGHVTDGDGPLAHHRLGVGLPPRPHVPHHGRTLDDVRDRMTWSSIFPVQQRLESFNVNTHIVIHLHNKPGTPTQPGDQR